MPKRKSILSSSDEDLMRYLKNSNSHEALSELYRRYSQRLLGYFIKMFKGDVPKSQDFLQELFIKVLEKKHQFDPNRKFFTWVFTVASNMCKTEFRKYEPSSLDYTEEAQKLSTVDNDLTDLKILRTELRKKINELDYNHRVVFILRYVEGFSLKDIAVITESNLGTVKSRLYYSTKKLAEQLKDFKPTIKSNNYG